MNAYSPATGEWNDSLNGDYLWSSVNTREAVPDVMTPSTWSLWQIYHQDSNPIKIPGNHHICGNIGGRPYLNLSLVVSLYRALGKDIGQELHGDMLGSVQHDLVIPIIPFTPWSVIWTVLPGMLKARRYASRDRRQVPEFVAATPDWCRSQGLRLQSIGEPVELARLWRETLRPYFLRASWLLRSVTLLFSDPAGRLRRDLTRLAGEADASLLLSNLAGGAADLESLGPLLGLAQVARGALSRAAYLDHYGHRGPHEMELFAPGTEEDPAWLDRRLAEAARSPVEVEALLAGQRAECAAARQRLEAAHPRQANALGRRLDEVASAARAREAVRSEMTRLTRLIRQYVLRVGALAGLGGDAFFLSLDEMIAVLTGDRAPTALIAARRQTYNRYCMLPPYPAIIIGRFDPFQWAADPDRRSDVFDARVATSAATEPVTITGHAGAAGCVEGVVRRIDCPEDGDLLQPGEILVTVTTNVGWTPIFPRAAAIITDVGAPLSHAAIVARELGLPAVVGCGNATARLKTGDRVRVDGGRGLVEMVG